MSKRRDLRTQYLVEAHRRLEGAANRNEPGVDNVKAIESAIADIQLLGSEKQAHLARGFALEFAENCRASLDPLFESLLAELREELGLSVLQEGITYLGISQGSQEKS